MNIINCDYLRNQINEKKAAKGQKMNDNEYALNQRLLQTIRIKEENENEPGNDFRNCDIEI